MGRLSTSEALKSEHSRALLEKAKELRKRASELNRFAHSVRGSKGCSRHSRYRPSLKNPCFSRRNMIGPRARVDANILKILATDANRRVLQQVMQLPRRSKSASGSKSKSQSQSPSQSPVEFGDFAQAAEVDDEPSPPRADLSGYSENAYAAPGNPMYARPKSKSPSVVQAAEIDHYPWMQDYLEGEYAHMNDGFQVPMYVPPAPQLEKSRSRSKSSSPESPEQQPIPRQPRQPRRKSVKKTLIPPPPRRRSERLAKKQGKAVTARGRVVKK
jgi:hypothetical protein